MTFSRTIVLFGNAQSKKLARIQIENHPQIHRIDMIANSRIRLLLYRDVKESEWISELKPCGIHGFCLL